MLYTAIVSLAGGETSLRILGQLGGEIDFGTLAVYTCSRSCEVGRERASGEQGREQQPDARSAYAEEQIWIQHISTSE